MFLDRRVFVGTMVLLLACLNLVPAQTPGKSAFVFRDVGDEAGLFPSIGGIRGHGAAWGDARGTGYPDLFVNTFHDQGSKPAMYFRNNKGKFTLDGQEHLRTSGMGSGALFVDLTNSGRLDLYVSNCAIDTKMPDSTRRIPSFLFRNDGDGKFTDVSKDCGAILPLFAGRGLSALDYDGDGLLDLVACERYYGPVKHGPALFRNLGNHKFENVSERAGMPPKLSTLGVAVADFNLDGWPDIVLAEGDGYHRLLLNDGKGKFADAPGVKEVLQWEKMGKEENCAGVCVGDLNNDGLPDIVIGHHPSAPWQKPLAIRVYLNRGVKNGVLVFEDVTALVGIEPLKMKAPHVEIQDFDNDGQPDIFVSIVKFRDNKPYPIIYRNQGSKNGMPRFHPDGWDVNDFPSAEELAIKRSGPLFDKLIKDRRIIYMAPGPSADFDRDGKLDVLLPNWWMEDRTLLLKNETPGGNWLDVMVEGTKGVNRMGIGSRIRLYPAGKLGEASALLGSREIAIGYGYCSGQEAVAHFGLGKHAQVDVEVLLPHGKGTLTQRGVAANQRLVLKQQ
jgi:hypothetical protein